MPVEPSGDLGSLGDEVTGDDVRRLQFSEAFRGYRPADVDALLEKVALAIDNGDSLEPLLRTSQLRRATHGYRLDDVDRALGGLRLSTSRPAGSRTPRPVPPQTHGAIRPVNYRSGTGPRNSFGEAVQRWKAKSPWRPVYLGLLMTGLGLVLALTPATFATPSRPKVDIMVIGWIGAAVLGAVTARHLGRAIRSRR